MKRSYLIGLILLSAPLVVLSAQSVWEGSCAVGGYGSFPSTGLYGASDSFPQNTLVTVENSQTNQKATVLIIDRLNDSGLFLLLSKDAGSAIGMGTGQVSQVRVTLAKQASSISQGPGDLPYSTDPDIFPAAGVGNPSSLSFLDQYLNGGTSSQPTPTPSASTQPNVAPPVAEAAQTPKIPQATVAPPALTEAPKTNEQKPASASPVATEQPAQTTGTVPATPPKTAIASAEKPVPAAPASSQPETGPSVSALSPQPEQRLAATSPTTPPPAPDLAQSAPKAAAKAVAPSPATELNPPQPSVASSSLPASQGSAQAAPVNGAQEVPSASGVQSGSAPVQTAQTENSTALPEVQPPVPSGPQTTGLEVVPTPRLALPSILAIREPSVPEKAGSAPNITALQPLQTPQAPMEIAMSGSPALPSIRNPGPMTTGIASSSPPASASSLVALAVPRAPEGTPSGPQITELAQASPTGSTFSATVSALPAIPSQNQPKTVQSNAPLVSALAQAKPPTSGDLLAQTGLPLPEIAGLTPDVTRLASETPSIGETAPVAVSEVPAVPSSQTTAINAASAPAVAQSQPSPSSVPAAPLTPASSPTEAPSKAAPATAGQPTSAAPVQTVAPAMAKAGRIPVRPSAALAAASYYLQLGVYGESSAALALADNLSPDYPVSVYAFKSNDKSLYKVMIGPLNSDESGTLLYLFTAQGYRDAFVRKGD